MDDDESDLTVLLEATALQLETMSAQLEAISTYVAAFARVDPADTSPEERARLDDVHRLTGQAYGLMSQALDLFS